jgi:hypothetical protein
MAVSGTAARTASKRALEQAVGYRPHSDFWAKKSRKIAAEIPSKRSCFGGKD